MLRTTIAALFLAAAPAHADKAGCENVLNNFISPTHTEAVAALLLLPTWAGLAYEEGTEGREAMTRRASELALETRQELDAILADIEAHCASLD